MKRSVMFKNSKQQLHADIRNHDYDAEPSSTALTWGEVIREDTEYADELPEYEFNTFEPELIIASPARQTAVSNSYSGYGIELDGGTIEFSQFPALRYAYGHQGAEQQPDTDVQPESKSLVEYLAESDGEDGLSWLIRRYAELDEQEEAQVQETEDAPQEEEVPALFAFQRDRKESADAEEVEEEQPDNFTMESELLLQQHISGELFEYISVLESDAAETKRQRTQSATKVKHYDPYNLSFNNRFEAEETERKSAPEFPSFQNKYDFIAERSITTEDPDVFDEFPDTYSEDTTDK